MINPVKRDTSEEASSSQGPQEAPKEKIDWDFGNNEPLQSSPGVSFGGQSGETKHEQGQLP